MSSQQQQKKNKNSFHRVHNVYYTWQILWNKMKNTKKSSTGKIWDKCTDWVSQMFPSDWMKWTNSVFYWSSSYGSMNNKWPFSLTLFLITYCKQKVSSFFYLFNKIKINFMHLNSLWWFNIYLCFFVFVNFYIIYLFQHYTANCKAYEIWTMNTKHISHDLLYFECDFSLL